MAKLSGPMLSFGGTGTLGKQVVFGRWRGVNYARQHVVPANPRTADQMEVRSVFTWIGEYWAYAPTPARLPWQAYARGKPMTDRNAQIKFNLPTLQSETDIQQMIFAPPVLGGPPPASMSATPGTAAGTIDATLTPQAIPQGWTITRAMFVALPDQDPHGPFVVPVVYAEDASSPYSVTLTGLPSGQACVVGAWFEYQRDDGRIAYGTSASATATPN